MKLLASVGHGIFLKNNLYIPIPIIDTNQFEQKYSCHLQQMQQVNFDICLYIMLAIFALAILFLYCYFGEMASNSFEKMINLLFECNWSILPVDLQKYLIIMIANAQRPIFYHGFHVIILNLETFGNVSFSL